MKTKWLIKIKKIIACASALLLCVAFCCACNQHEVVKYGDWQHDDSFHWRLDSNGELVDKGIHNFIWWKCTLCGYQTAPPEHVHSFATKWSYDERYHWHEPTCDCEDVEVEKVPHEFDGDICIHCGYTKPAAAVPDDEENPDNPPDNPDYPEDPDNPPDNPDEPDEPDPPVDPDEPDEPDPPVDPEDPDEPDPPVDPEDPDEPDPPVDPEDPDEPDPPVDPEDPDEPDPPVDPDEPDEPNPPVDPDEPDTPTDPDTPVDPEDPDEPDTPPVVDPNKPPLPGQSGGTGGDGGGEGTGGFTPGEGTHSGTADEYSPNVEAQQDLIFTPLLNEAGEIYAYTVMADKSRNKRKYIEIPNKYEGLDVIAIVEHGFSDMSSLETIYIPSSIKSIGYEAFYNSSLKEINLPNTVEELGARAFASCKKLEKVKLPNNPKLTKLEYEMFTYSTALGDIVIPDNITYITTRVFEYAQMRSLTIGRGLQEVGRQAFNQSKITNGISIYDLKQWCQMVFPSQISSPLYWGHKLYQISSDGKRVDLITNLKIPDEITKLNRFTFVGCTTIKSVDLSNIDELKDEVFLGCTGLQTVKLSENLKELTANIFHSCYSLKEITLPKNVTVLPYCCFYDCRSLTKITCEANIEYIDALALSGCKALQTIEIPGTVDDWKETIKKEGRMWTMGMGNFNIVCKGDNTTITKAEDLEKYSDYDPRKETYYVPKKDRVQSGNDN